MNFQHTVRFALKVLLLLSSTNDLLGGRSFCNHVNLVWGMMEFYSLYLVLVGAKHSLILLCPKLDFVL